MRKILGIIFILLGFLGGFLPIMPGFVFFIMGISMLSPELEKKIKNLHRRYRCHRNIKKLAKEYVDLTQDTIKSKLKSPMLQKFHLHFPKSAFRFRKKTDFTK